jgi:hypothetical protein
MKLNQIMLAAVAALTANVAMAGLTPAQIESARTAGTLDQAWIAGASAPTKTIYEGWVKGCVAGTSSIFTSQAASNAAVTPGSLGNFVAYACTRGTRTSVLYHTVDGGSLNAFTPFTNGTKLARVKYLGSASCTKLATGYVDNSSGGSVNNGDVYKGCVQTGAAVILGVDNVQTATNNSANAAALVADTNAPQTIVGGFSDVEPTLFESSIGGGNVSNKGAVSNAFLGQAFGVAVSIPLYRKLQAIQNITDTSGTSFDPAFAPSLTKADLASILSDSGTVKTNESWAPILGEGNIAGTEQVRIERRVATSGSQASSNAFFLGNPCTGNSALLPADVSSGNYVVSLNAGSGNVKANITTASNNTNTDQQYAIGVLSLENDWRVESAANAGYRFIKIDGIHPEQGDTSNARAASASAIYPFHNEMKAFVSNTAPAGFQRNIVTTIVNALKNTTGAACSTLPRGLTLNPDTPASSCVVGVVKAKTTKDGNNCAPATIF